MKIGNPWTKVPGINKAKDDTVTKLEALLGSVGLCLAVGGFVLFDTDFGGAADNVATRRGAEVIVAVTPPRPSLSTVPDVDSTRPRPAAAPIPNEAPLSSPSKRTSTVIAEPAVIQVTARPSSVLAGPSSSAPLLYGFPAGRQLRVVGHDAGFAQIKDLKSGAWGWIDETALASNLRSASVDPGPKPAKRQASIDSESKSKADTDNRQAAIVKPATLAPVFALKRRPRGLFGGVKRADGRDSFPGFLQRAFGSR